MQPRIKIETLFPVIYLLPTIILIEGFASIAIEILTIRQLLPVVGSSVIVTSLIIGVFLLFLAIGYERGGKTTDNLYHVLRRNFFIAAIWVGIGLSYLFIKLFFNFVYHINTHTILPLLIYLLLILSPAIFLLGQTLPITMNIVRQNQLAGAIAGKTLGLSTIGSFLGATLTTLVLMHYLGVAITVFFIFALLMSLALLLSQSREAFVVQALGACVAALVVYSFNIVAEQQMFVLTDNHANYQILDYKNINAPGNTRYLIVNESYSSKIDDNGEPFPYVKVMQKIILDDLKMREAEILVLGAGGFTLSAGDTKTNHFTYVDIDDRIQQVVEPQFLKKINGELIAADARHYIKATQKKYDVIVVDAYSNITSIPAHLLTAQFMHETKKRLKNNGYVLINIIANPFFNDAYSRRIDNTIRNAFGSCAVAPLHYRNAITNIIYVCNNHTDMQDNVVYTDNLNNSTMDSYSW